MVRPAAARRIWRALWRIRACRAGLSAWYVRAPRLFEELNLCHADGTFRKRLAAIAKISLLVIDDFAISPIGRANATTYWNCSMIAPETPLRSWQVNFPLTTGTSI